MITLYETLESSRMLCESFADSRLYQVGKSLADQKITWATAFSNVNVSWDKISKNDIEEYDKPDLNTLIKQIKSKRQGNDDERPAVLIGMINEEVKYVFENIWMRFGVIYNNSIQFYQLGAKGKFNISQSEIFADIKSCDYVLKVYIDHNSTSDLKTLRAKAQSGSWDMTDSDHKSIHLDQGVLGKSAGGMSSHAMYGSFYNRCNVMAKETITKYKKILALRKFNDTQDTADVDKAVENILARVPKACQNATKDPTKYDAYDLGILMSMIYDKYTYVMPKGNSGGYVASKDAILSLYTKFCREIMSIKNNSSYNISHSVENRDNYKTEILKQIDAADKKLKEFDA